ncbi:MAG TPA: (2Fe-2S)-binding protein [Burkholderiales bacterium]|jgi:bacterioferritin-associated ferredoxin|nr:(2Fe-2S)-binding protein [Burkholderiales bacterium]
MYVCLCNGVTEQDIRRCAREGACSLADLAMCAGVGAGCGRCREMAATVLSEAGQLESGSRPAALAQAVG